MGQLKEKMTEWMEDQHLSQEDLDNMDNVDEQFTEWFNNSMKLKKQ
jgi:hypothetical protein